MPVRLSAEPLDPRALPATVGGLDPLFTPYLANVAAGANQITAALVQPDGRIVLAGTTDATNPANADVLIVRLNADGTADTTFNGTGRLVLPSFAPGSDDQATAVGLQSNGSVVVGGWTNKAGTYDLAAVRVTPAGGLDTGFGVNGYAVLNPGGTDKAYALAVMDDDRLVLAGSADDADTLAVARLTAAGRPDPTFNGGTVRRFDLGGAAEARGAAVYADDTILLAGWRAAANAAADTVAVRVAADGAFLAANFGTDEFDTGTEINTFARLDAGGEDKALAVQLLPDNTFVTAGYSTAGTARRAAVARFGVDGTPDPAFGSGGLARPEFGGTDAQAAALVVQPDGRPVVAGFTNAGGVYKAAVARLTATGAPDLSFAEDGTAVFAFGTTAGDDKALALARDPAGRLVAAGRAAGSVAADRLVGRLGLPTTLAASGQANGTGVLLDVPAGAAAYDPAAAGTVTYFSGFAGTVRTAAADVTGDGVADKIAVAGPGAAPVLTVRDGATDRVLVQPFNVYEPTFTGGLFVSAADLTGDGRADVVVTPDRSGGPVVVVYDGAGLAAGRSGQSAQLARFFGIQDPAFRGGARAALGDVDADGVADLLVAAGFGGGPRVALYDGATVLDPLPAGTAASTPVPPKLLPDFFVFEDTLRNGAFVAAGDLNGDGHADLVFGGGPGGGPRVRAVDGRQLLALGTISSLDAIAPGGFQLANFFAGSTAARGGVTITAKDVDGDELADLIAGSGEGQAARLVVYTGANLLANPTPAADQALDLFGGAALPGGVFVG